MASSSSSKTLRADELYSEHLIEFMDRVWFAALPLPFPSHHFLNAPRRVPSARRAAGSGAVSNGQTSSPPPSSASSESSGSDVELELATDPEDAEATSHVAAAAAAAAAATAAGAGGGGPKPRTAASKAAAAAAAGAAREWCWFCIDDELTYLSFAHDFGPLNISKVYDFCIRLHSKLEDPTREHVNFVLYTSTDPRRKANAALLVALYAMIVGRKKPWEAFQPIAEMEFMPFRDAGRCETDYGLSIQDCLYGISKALELGLLDLSSFDPEEYCFYEQVQNGDFNWVSKDFIAFASPTDNAYVRALNTGQLAAYERETMGRKRSRGYANVLRYFEENRVRLVVRLNNPLYDRRDFERRGIEFKDMFFEDGTNPPPEMVREFLRDADRIIDDNGVIAIHCKAGLGRTGCLIAAHLVYKYGFTAGEVIGFMRICRPGMVVGPQQQYIHHNHLEWVKWAAADEAIAQFKASLETERRSAAARAVRLTITARPTTPPTEFRSDATDVDMDPLSTPARRVAMPSITPARMATAADGMSPCLQPRKTPLAAKRTADALDEENDSSSDLDDDPLGRLPAHTLKYRKSGQTERIEVETMLLSSGAPQVPAPAPLAPAPQYRSAARAVPLSSPAKKSSGTSFGAESTSTAVNHPITGGLRPTRMAKAGSASSAVPVSTRKVGPQTESRVGMSKTLGLEIGARPIGLPSPTPKAGAIRTAGSPSSRLPTLSGLPIRSGVKRLFAGASTTAGSKTGKVKAAAESASAGGVRLDSGKRILRKRRSSLSIDVL